MEIRLIGEAAKKASAVTFGRDSKIIATTPSGTLFC